MLKRRISIKHNNNLRDTYSYWIWCRNLEEQPLRLQLRGAKHPINGILNGHLVPLKKEEHLKEEVIKNSDKTRDRSDIDKLLSSILNKSKYKNMFKQAKNLFKNKDCILDLNEKFLLLKTK